MKVCLDDDGNLLHALEPIKHLQQRRRFHLTVRGDKMAENAIAGCVTEFSNTAKNNGLGALCNHCTARAVQFRKPWEDSPSGCRPCNEAVGQWP